MKSHRSPGACCGHEALASGLAALSHPVRIEILRHLSRPGASCCKDVVGHVHLAQSTVSQHLKVLLEAGLLRMEQKRQASLYQVDAEALMALSRQVAELAETCCRTRSETGTCEKAAAHG